MAAVKGYKIILTMPETMSLERRVTLLALRSRDCAHAGPQRHEGRDRQGQRNSGEDAQRLYPSAIRQSGQSGHSPEATTGPEIWDDTDGKVDILISGVGTGGTITGVANYIKPKKPSFKAIAVEPTDSPVLSGGKPGPHKIQGIGAGFVPSILDTKLIDEVVQVTNDESVEMARRLATRRRALCRNQLRRCGCGGIEGSCTARERRQADRGCAA